MIIFHMYFLFIGLLKHHRIIIFEHPVKITECENFSTKESFFFQKLFCMHFHIEQRFYILLATMYSLLKKIFVALTLFQGSVSFRPSTAG